MLFETKLIEILVKKAVSRQQFSLILHFFMSFSFTYKYFITSLPFLPCKRKQKEVMLRLDNRRAFYFKFV